MSTRANGKRKGKKKRYDVVGLVRKGYGYHTQSTRAFLRATFWKEYNRAYEE